MRRGIADVATSRRRLELQIDQLRQAADRLQAQAGQAVDAGRDDLGREALTRRAAALTQLAAITSQRDALQSEEDKLTASASRLQAKVEAFRTRKETLKAGHTAAEAQTRIGEAVSGISEEMGDVGLAMQHAEDKTAQMQARAQAIDGLLRGEGPDAGTPCALAYARQASSTGVMWMNVRGRQPLPTDAPSAQPAAGLALASAVGPVTDRATPTDLAFLSMDRGAVPEQFAAVLVFTRGTFDLSHAQVLLAERVAAVPRLRQRLVHSPPGCGRPIWVDDASFDIRRHVRQIRCRAPGDERALLDTAAIVIMERLPRSRPLWSAVFITGLADDAVALVLVVHHVLADGIGGLAVLASLADPPDRPVAEPIRPFPARRPSAGRLAVDALKARSGALAHAPAAWRELRRSIAAGGGVAPARIASCSLTRPTGPRRRLGVVYADLASLRTAAHQAGGTVNDAVLTGVAGALRQLLVSRGERVDAFAVAVPVAGRRAASAARLGNQVAPLVVTASGMGDPGQRIAQVAAAVRAGKASAAGPPPIAVLGSLFRAVAALGGFRWYMRHQHRIHTLVTHVRGPDQPLTFAGATVKAIIPVSVGEAGNTTVSFTVLSYAGTIAITAVADPDHVPDLPVLTRELRAELASIAHLAG